MDTHSTMDWLFKWSPSWLWKSIWVFNGTYKSCCVWHNLQINRKNHQEIIFPVTDNYSLFILTIMHSTPMETSNIPRKLFIKLLRIFCALIVGGGISVYRMQPMKLQTIKLLFLFRKIIKINYISSQKCFGHDFFSKSLEKSDCINCPAPAQNCLKQSTTTCTT